MGQVQTCAPLPISANITSRFLWRHAALASAGNCLIGMLTRNATSKLSGLHHKYVCKSHFLYFQSAWRGMVQLL